MRSVVRGNVKAVGCNDLVLLVNTASSYLRKDIRNLDGYALSIEELCALALCQSNCCEAVGLEVARAPWRSQDLGAGECHENFFV